ncbi:LOW QUALITY PROTEIN: phospholipid-transporting ATPase IK [Rhynchonycteris naso]
MRLTPPLMEVTGKVVCEEPNSQVHHFMEHLKWEGRKYSLDNGNILPRGCKIRNTECYGMVIYAGFDTKIMRNCGKVHLKRTKIDHLMNKLVILNFVSLVLLSMALTLGFWDKVTEFKAKHCYVSGKHMCIVTTESFLTFLGFLILLSVMVPMTMFIMAKFIYLGNSIFINWEMQMYYEPQDMPAKALSTNLNNQLCQVEYIFSDKTGTLTRNIMTFKKCCIENPYLWNKFADGKLLFQNATLLSALCSNKDRMVQEFWYLLAICHMVMVQEKDSECFTGCPACEGAQALGLLKLFSGLEVVQPNARIPRFGTCGRPAVVPDQLLYQAASPDKEALVTAARNFGYVFLARTRDSITVMELGEKRVYQSFAEQTLRTLCLAYKKVDEGTHKEWHQWHHKASILLQNRAQTLHQVYEEMEQNLQLLGATAIEDRLQDGILETIQCLKQGNIKVWVLTRDKQETAVNIDFACQILSEDMLILEEKEIFRIVEAYWESNNLLNGRGSLKNRFLPQDKMVMVINGDFLDRLLLSLSKESQELVENVNVDVKESRQKTGEQTTDFLQARRLSLMQTLRTQLRSPGSGSQNKNSNSHESPEVWWKKAFVELASRCQAVICCWVTPKQKALIVALVKKQNGVTLAIGDDQDYVAPAAADIGVGLTGQEGMQAVQNSDHVLAQFCFLRRLLLVHGRWSYMVCKFLRYFIYKTLASMMVHIWFAFYSGFTAQPLYEGWFLTLFNLLYTALPVLYIRLFEQDMSAEQRLEQPELYIAGQKDELFNYWVFFQAIAHGMATSLVNFFMTTWISHDTAGPLSDYQSFAVVMALSGLLPITMEFILSIKYWTILSVMVIFFSLCFYVVVTWSSQGFWLFTVSPKTFPFPYADRNVLPHTSILLVVLLNVSLNTLLILVFCLIYQALKKPHAKEEEEARTEEITVEPLPYLDRESDV